MKYVLFQKKDGRIIGTGSVTARYDISQFEDEHTGVLVVEALPGDGHKVVDGNLAPVEPGDFEDDLLAEAWFNLRAERHARLAASDWTQVPDAPVDQSAWAIYRQQLRDLPANTADPRQVVWPAIPE